MTTIQDLQSEDLANIFKRLRVKDILRCSSVQKSWYECIHTPNFVTLHFNHQIVRPNDKFLFFRTSFRYDIRRDDFECEEYFMNCRKPEVRGNLYTCSYGLVCLTRMTERSLFIPEKIFLWNPLIRKCKTLPPSPIPLLQDPKWHVFAFGYSPAVDDYFAVRVVKPSQSPNQIDRSVLVAVYTLSTDSWRYFTGNNVLVSDVSFDFSVFINGVAYWLGDAYDMKGILLSFNTTNDTLHELALPETQDVAGEQFYEEDDSDCDYDYPHGIYSTYQSLAYFYGNNRSKTLSMWILKEGDIWELKLRLALDTTTRVRDVCVPDIVIGSRNNGEPILASIDKDDDLVSYVPDQDELQVFLHLKLLRRHPRYGDVTPKRIYPFLETLLFLDE